MKVYNIINNWKCVHKQALNAWNWHKNTDPQHHTIWYTETIIFCFVHSQINYAIELYLNTCDSYFDKICKLNNKILRILQNKHLYFPVVELYKNFNALPPLKLHEQQIFVTA